MAPSHCTCCILEAASGCGRAQQRQPVCVFLCGCLGVLCVCVCATSYCPHSVRESSMQSIRHASRGRVMRMSVLVWVFGRVHVCATSEAAHTQTARAPQMHAYACSSHKQRERGVWVCKQAREAALTLTQTQAHADACHHKCVLHHTNTHHREPCSVPLSLALFSDSCKHTASLFVNQSITCQFNQSLPLNLDYSL